jgi:hypothetical protein
MSAQLVNLSRRYCLHTFAGTPKKTQSIVGPQAVHTFAHFYITIPLSPCQYPKDNFKVKVCPRLVPLPAAKITPFIFPSPRYQLQGLTFRETANKKNGSSGVGSVKCHAAATVYLCLPTA